MHFVESEDTKPMNMEGLIVYQIDNEMLVFIGFYKYVEYSDFILLVINLTASVSIAQSYFRPVLLMF